MGEPYNLQLISNTFGDELFYEVNRNCFDRLGARNIFQRQFGDDLSRTDSLYIIIGTDSGLLPGWLLSKGLPEGSRYLFIELAEVIAALGARLNVLTEDPRVSITTPDDWQSLQEDFQFTDYACLESISVTASIAAQDAYIPEYRTIRRETQKAVDQFIWKTSYQLGSQVFVKRHIENLTENRVPAIVLNNQFAGRTAVILGGGPSLDAFIPWIKENRQRITVIAVSRISRRLLEAGLHPDIVVSIDPNSISFDVSKESLRFGRNTLLVNAYHVSTPLLAQWHGPSAYFGPRYPWLTSANPLNTQHRGPTVTNAALAMAVEMGFETIIFGGVDLCYSREGHTHAMGSNERQAGPLLGSEDTQVETNGGWLADTNHAFAEAVTTMGQQAQEAVDQGCTLINSAVTAAKIPNVRYCPIEELPKPEPSEPSTSIIARHIPQDIHADRMRHYQGVKQELAHINGRLRGMGKLALEALECNDGLFGRNGKKADFKYKKRMDKIERKLDREYKDLAPLIKNFGARTFLRLVRPDKDKEWSDEEIERWGRGYYESYKTSADLLLDLVSAAQERLAARMEELGPEPNIGLLAAQWKKDGTPGRARILLENNPSLGLNEYELLQNIREFEAILDNDDTQQARLCTDRYTLAPVQGRLTWLFQHHDLDALEHIATELARQSSEEANELTLLATGYLQELSDQPEEALLTYQQMIDSAAHALSPDREYDNPRLEDALRHMSAIAINQGDTQNALLILDALTSLSPNYAPQYAELLRITGNLQAAADLYTDYLQRAPHDISSFMRLGKLYQDAGAIDSAIWIYRHIVTGDPTNETALQLLDSLEKVSTNS